MRHANSWRAFLSAMYDKNEAWKFDPYQIGNVKEKCTRPVLPQNYYVTRSNEV